MGERCTKNNSYISCITEHFLSTRYYFCRKHFNCAEEELKLKCTYIIVSGTFKSFKKLKIMFTKHPRVSHNLQGIYASQVYLQIFAESVFCSRLTKIKQKTFECSFIKSRIRTLTQTFFLDFLVNF